jgi:DNA gyrase subunit B
MATKKHYSPAAGAAASTPDSSEDNDLLDDELDLEPTGLLAIVNRATVGAAESNGDGFEHVGPDQEALDHTVQKAYTADSLRVLEGREAVRQRPAMYIGDRGKNGLHHLFFEILDNCIDEVLAGRASEVDVKINADKSISVRDNGNGIPTGINTATGLTGVELAMTKLHGGGKFGDGGYKVSGGLHGVGLSVVNFLSERCEAVVEQTFPDEPKKSGVFKFECFRGVPLGPLKKIGDSDGGHGSTITWFADSEIFGDYEYDPEVFIARIQNTCYLNREVKVTFTDNLYGTDPATQVFHYERGIAEFVEHLNETKDSIGEVIYFSKTRDMVQADIALQYNTGYSEQVLSFANNVHTKEGGTHLSGFRTALTRSINQYARKNQLLKEKDVNFSGDDVREGLTAIISVRMTEPQFEGQTKGKLGNTNVEGIVNSIVGECLGQFLEEHPAIGKRIIDKALTAQRARDAARKAADLIKRQSALESNSLPGKLADCTDKNPDNCELYLVEGDSAGGSAKAGRDRRFQAVLPLRGKIINVGKAALDKTLENNEVKSMIMALGIGIKVDSDESEEGESTSNFDLSKLRYNRIIIMTDADVDGDHIRTLLLTFFFQYMRPLIEEGHVWIAMPPLYSIKAGKDKRYYARTELERDTIVAGLKKKDVQVGRFKGLGEMNAEELFDTTMDRKTRSMAQVKIDDAEKADVMFNVLMSDKVDPRKAFIIKHAKDATNVDWHC